MKRIALAIFGIVVISFFLLKDEGRIFNSISENYSLNQTLGDSGRGLASTDKTLAEVNYQRSFITLDESVNITGLVPKPGKDSEYVRRLFGKLVQKSHSISNEAWLDESRNYFLSYNTFVLGSVLLPMHESSLMHITKRDPSKWCYFSNDVIDPIVKSDFAKTYYPEKIKLHYDNIMNGPKAPGKFKDYKSLLTKFCKDPKVHKTDEQHEQCYLLNKKRIKLSNANYLTKNINLLKKIMPDFSPKHCSTLTHLPTANQILFSNDYADIGLLMINSKSHPEFFRSGQIFDIDKVIDHGLNFLYEGFNIIANYNLSKNSKLKLPCYDGVDARTYRGRMDLIRGAWAGKYNSGKVHRSCRFSDPLDIFAQNDVNFRRNLSKIFFNYKGQKKYNQQFGDIPEDEKVKSLYESYLPKDSLEYLAFMELIDNVYNGRNDDHYLKQVLVVDYDGHVDEVKIIHQRTAIETETNAVEESISDHLDIAASDSESETSTEGQEKNISTIAPVKTEVEIIAELDPKLENEEISPEDDSRAHNDDSFIPVDRLTAQHISGSLQVDIPEYRPSSFTYMIKGYGVNFRSAPSIERRDLCGNTNSFTPKNGVIKVGIIEVGEVFSKLQFENRDELVISDSCRDENIFYVHNAYLAKIKNYIVNEVGELKTFITLRDHHGMSKSRIIGTHAPGMVEVVGKKVLTGRNGKRYLWIQIVVITNEQVQKRWFYAGLDGDTIRYEAI